MYVCVFQSSTTIDSTARLLTYNSSSFFEVYNKIGVSGSKTHASSAFLDATRLLSKFITLSTITVKLIGLFLYAFYFLSLVSELLPSTNDKKGIYCVHIYVLNSLRIFFEVWEVVLWFSIRMVKLLIMLAGF